jgi:Zn-dependent protease with chaperone function
MQQEKFNNLVEKYTERARKSPFLYRLHVFAAALFGYVYIYIILLILIFLILLILASLASGHAAAIKLLILFTFLAYTIIKALWIKFEKPMGLKLTVKDAPILFHELNDLKRLIKSPKIHEVLMNTTYNAGVSQVPRFGFFGGYRNYLILGLPYLGAMTHEEFKAVLAHELGHLNRAHGRLGSWIYRIRASWFNLVDRLEKEDNWGLFLFRPFFKKYIPYFNALTVVMSRAQEFEADRLASQFAGLENNASSLLNGALKHRYLETHFWPEINSLSTQIPKPIPDLYTQMFSKLKEPLTPEEAERWSKEELAIKTQIFDSHPSLSERLEDIGYTPINFQAFSTSAAEYYFEEHLPVLLEHFNTSWQKSVQEDWEQRFQDQEDKKHQLDELNRKAETEELTPQENFDLASLYDYFNNPEKALGYYQLVYHEYPDDPLVNYYLGHTLLQLDDKTGITYLEKAMDLDSEATENACRLIYDFLIRSGNPSEAEKYYNRAVKYHADTTLNQEERNTLTSKDKFSHHELPPEKIESLLEQLKRYSIKHAYLIKKETTIQKETPLYGLLVEISIPWYKGLTSKSKLKTQKEFVDRIAKEITFPVETLIISGSTDMIILRRKFKKVKGSKLF